MCLVLTDSGVADCPVIDQEQLDALAKWLCDQNSYHDRLAEWATASDEAFERQCKEQGYCNACRDFAGEILARFTLTERTDR